MLSPTRHLLLAAALALLAYVGAPNTFSSEMKEERALQRMRQFQAHNQVPTVAASVLIDGEVFLAKAVGTGGFIVPDGEKTRYHIGSLTKQFTAAAILALIEDGTVVPSTGSPFTLETTIRDLEPTIDAANPVGQITIRRLLTMTANFPNYTDDGFLYTAGKGGFVPASRAIDVVGVIERLKTYKLSEPRGKFEYSNTNYFILALAIQVLKGGRATSAAVAHNYMHERILARAGMTSAGFYSEPTSAGVMDAQPNYLRTPFFDQGDWLLGAGDMISSIEDMARWHTALMAGRVIELSWIEMMSTPAAPSVTKSRVYVGCRYAMGCYVCERPDGWLYQHDGVVSGFMASSAVTRKSDGSWIGVTALANSDATIEIVKLVRDLIEIADPGTKSRLGLQPSD
jgi:CubicO group peptidase (beta-lactamase class C family)